jgi:hypothetical protein
MPGTKIPSADELALSHLSNGALRADTETGAITRPNGKRAESVNPRTGYGQVHLGKINGKIRIAYAHRVIWMAAHGLIPANLVINHRNGRRWDNRISNLELTTRSGNVLHAHGHTDYDHLDGPVEIPTGPQPAPATPAIYNSGSFIDRTRHGTPGTQPGRLTISCAEATVGRPDRRQR